MATMITRRISETRVTAYELQLDEGIPHVVKLGEMTMSGTPTETQARAAFRLNGIHVPRGAKVDIQSIGEGKLYAMDIETFMKYATVVDESKYDEK